MTPPSPIMAAGRLAIAFSLLLSAPMRADETPSASAAALSLAAKALDDLEAQAPKEWKDVAAISASHVRVVALVDANTLQSGEEFRRAASLLSFHLNEYRIIRAQYELMLAAVAKGDESAEKSLSIFYDQLMSRLGRPYRFDFGAFAQKNPEFAEYEPAPVCIQAVWRDPAAARATTAGVADNPEIKSIVDADQADRQGNRTARTPEEREASTARDKVRNARMREIVATGEVRTANDFARAGLVLQHSARFAGYRLAHELAVASMLLGDRSGGRWLVAASYDRMLLSVGLDQRFGTQYGPTGLSAVDEAGICDNERQALGCPTLEQARNPRTRGTQVVDKRLSEILRPDNLIEDAKTGLHVRYPQGWKPQSVVPAGKKAESILFSPSAETPAINAAFYYRLNQPAPPSDPAAAAVFLRDQAALKEKDRQGRSPDYKNRPDSFALKRLNGQTALAWVADYERDDAKWSEYLIRVLGKSSVGLFLLNAPADQIEALRPALDAMADTVELP